MSNVILVLDANGALLEIAPTHPDLRYCPSEQQLGKTAYDLFPREEADRFQAAIREALERCETVQLECSMAVAEGEVRFVAAISPLSEDTVLLVARDVTAEVEQRERALAAERARAEMAEHLERGDQPPRPQQSGDGERAAPDAGAAGERSEGRRAPARSGGPHPHLRGHPREDLRHRHRGGGPAGYPPASRRHATGHLRGGGGGIHRLRRLRPLPTRAATNLAVVTNELMTNSLKYGAPAEDGRLHIDVTVTREAGRLCISVWNSGNPVPEDFQVAAQDRMGLRLVGGIVAQYGGAFDLRPFNGGTLAHVQVDRVPTRAMSFVFPRRPVRPA